MRLPPYGALTPLFMYNFKKFDKSKKDADRCIIMMDDKNTS